MPEQKETFPYRIWWTWDHRMDWIPGSPGTQSCGCSNPYFKPPEAFEEDYRRAVDAAVEYNINGIIIWGFLRESHGGEAAARRVCEYALDSGIRILPGVGTSEYGGYYYEGDHYFSATRYLATHPDRRAMSEKGEPLDRVCPSNPFNQEWLAEGMAWLYREFPLGGVNLEHGDFAVCHCDECKKAREGFPPEDPDYYKDMAVSIGPALEAAYKADPTSWITYATYTGFAEKMSEHPPAFVSYLPEWAIAIWTTTRMLKTPEFVGGGITPKGEGQSGEIEEWPDGLVPPTRHSIALIHQSSRWTGGAQISCIAPILQEWCLKSHRAKIDGLIWYGEIGTHVFPALLNYRAFRYFSQHPDAELSDWAKDDLSDLCGNEKWALDFVEILANRDLRKETVENNYKRANDYYLSFHWLPEFKQHFHLEVIRSWEWLLHVCSERLAARHGADEYGRDG